MPREPVIPDPHHRLRFLVASASKKGHRWMVDLETHQCSCPHHQYRGARCHHIQEARDFFTDTMLELIAQQLKRK